LNNASEGISWKALQEKYKNNDRIVFFNSDTNLGPGRGRNVLLEKCIEEWIFLVDNDICIQPADSWKALFDTNVAMQKGARIFCPKVFNVHENSYAIPHHFTKRDSTINMEEATTTITNYFSCCGVIIHRKIFEAYGNFDAELFAFEDYEFSIRALCSPMGAFEVYPLQGIELVHDHQVQQKKVDKKAVLERYDEDRIRASLQRLVDKHGIIFDHNWQWWTRKQVADMTGRSFLKKIKHILGRWYSR